MEAGWAEGRESYSCFIPPGAPPLPPTAPSLAVIQLTLPAVRWSDIR